MADADCIHFKSVMTVSSPIKDGECWVDIPTTTAQGMQFGILRKGDNKSSLRKNATTKIMSALRDSLALHQ